MPLLSDSKATGPLLFFADVIRFSLCYRSSRLERRLSDTSDFNICANDAATAHMPDKGLIFVPGLRRNARPGGRGLWLLISFFFLCFGLGFLIASVRWGDNLGSQLNQLVLKGAAAYTSLYQVARTAPPRTSEYLIFLNRGVSVPTYMGYIEGHPDIQYLSESIYPNAIRVALNIPVRDTLADLQTQPFARFVIRNYPFLFCH